MLKLRRGPHGEPLGRVAALVMAVLVAAACAGLPAPSLQPTVAPTPTPVPISLTGTILDVSDAGPDAIDIVAEGFEFIPDSITISGDGATFLITNADNVRWHNFRLGVEQFKPVAGLVGGSDEFGPGEGEALRVDGLEPGTYYFWCTVGAHWLEGMWGTLTVEP